MQYVRGSRHDYDLWEELGCQGWSYREVLPYFIKSENNTNKEYVKSGKLWVKIPRRACAECLITKDPVICKKDFLIFLDPRYTFSRLARFHSAITLKSLTAAVCSSPVYACWLPLRPCERRSARNLTKPWFSQTTMLTMCCCLYQLISPVSISVDKTRFLY